MTIQERIAQWHGRHARNWHLVVVQSGNAPTASWTPGGIRFNTQQL